MALALAIALLAVLVGLVLGGRPVGLTRLGVRWAALLVVAAAAQLADAVLLPGSQWAYLAALLVTTVLAAAFIGANIGVPGVPLIGLGLLLNGLVIAANGAMPVSVDALRAAGASWLTAIGDARHVLVGPSTRLSWLGDVVPVANPLHREVVSVGDLLVCAGLGLLIVTGMLEARSARRTEPARRARSEQQPGRVPTRVRRTIASPAEPELTIDLRQRLGVHPGAGTDHTDASPSS